MLVLTGGGTGGHLNVLKSIKEELIGLEEMIYVGSTNGQEKVIFAEDKHFAYLYLLPSIGLKRGLFAKIKAFLRLLFSVYQAVKIIQKHKIQKIISVGGYSSAPISIASIIMNRELYIHEQNAVAGRLNLLCKPFAKKFFCSFDIANATKTKYPIREDYVSYKRIRQEFRCVLFIGGSQGAVFINDLALSLAPYFKQKNIRILHQTGKQDLQRITLEYKKLDIQADVFDFEEKMYLKMQQADLAISRAGASTLWETVHNHLPTLFIPYPSAIFNHQYHNANFLVNKNLAFIAQQKNINKASIIKQIDNINIRKISVKLEKFSHTFGTLSGAKEIVSNL